MSSSDGGYGRNPSIPFHISLIIVTFIGIALYNVIELNIIILNTFKTRRCLYFWSFVVATWGIPLWSLGYLVKDFRLVNGYMLYSTFIAIGWCAMVTGQSFVLYSRLHIILQNWTYLRLVLAMIIINAVVLHVPTIVIGFGANSNDPGVWLKLYPIFEKIEVTIFFLQELFISSLYIIYTTKYFRKHGAILGKKMGTMKQHLIWVNVLVIALDITILALEYGGYYDIQTVYKGMVYSVKLKLEFGILNDLANVTKAGQAGSVQLATYVSNDGEWRRQSASKSHEKNHLSYGVGVYASIVESNRDTSAGLSDNRVTTRNVTSGVKDTNSMYRSTDTGSFGGPSAPNLAVGDSARVESSSLSDVPFAHDSF